MNNIAHYILILLVVSNMFTFFRKSPIRSINLILLAQFGISFFISQNFIGKNNELIITSNILIDMIALSLITIFYRNAFNRNKNYKIMLDGILSAIIMMFVTHLLVAFYVIKTFDMYYGILNLLSLFAVSLGLIGGIMGAVNGLNNKNQLHSRIIESNRINRGGFK